MKRFEYKIISIPISFWSGKPKKDYKKIIQDHAMDGWKLIQIFVPKMYPAPSVFELIFEKEK